ncbi:hypothetical protein EDD17DRAFT_1517242 [Pisolithus thermaeus]|nr:hypothetical protein EDD17DRAFT_1517242 [Pisolithus thermaeus]
MPQVASIPEPSADSVPDLNTHVLCNCKIPPLQCVPASKWVKSGGVTGSVGSDGGGENLQPSTTNKPKLWCGVEPPKGWDEHMLSLRDRRCSATPHSSTMTPPILPSPSQCQEVQDTEMEVEAESKNSESDMKDGGKGDAPMVSEEDELNPSSEEDEKSSDYNKGNVNSDDHELEESSSNYNDDADACTLNVQALSGDQSSLPLSSPPEDESDYSSPIKYPRSQQKGTAKAIDTEDADVVDHGGCKIPHSKKSGCLSKTVLEEIHAFAKNIKMTAKELGQWHRWSACNILVTMGFSVKPSHTKLNDANLFCSWYWAMQPKPDGAHRNAINNLITKEYNSLMKDIPKDDLASEWPMQRPNSLDWYTVTSVQAEAWSNLEDIEIVGVVMYIGQDPAGHQMSGIFGGSVVIRDFINEKAIDIWGLMDKYMAIFKQVCLRNGDGMEARLETPRDCNCRVFGSMMKEKLLAALRDICITQGIEVSDPQKVTWNWCKVW